ncbi:MAG: hypothetical protein LBR76_01325 [Oscillospiraceae bacterium]|jgi:membrane protein implicated in regulation of membrane protease activity|nr:hypothetical protein [Oscillospiraceae bacterium]
MVAWWVSLSILEQALALVAIPATVILLIQTVMLLFGFGSDGGDFDHGGSAGFDGADGMDIGDSFDASAHDYDAADLAHAEAGGDPGLAVFTVRGFIAFFTVFGWCGLAMMRSGVHPALSLTAAVLAGGASMFLTAYAFVLAMKLQQRGNTDIRNALGRSGSVYIRIPALRRSAGKITMVLQGKFSEVDAVTEETSDLMPGEEVTVIGISNQDTLLVTRKTV